MLKGIPLVVSLRSIRREPRKLTFNCRAADTIPKRGLYVSINGRVFFEARRLTGHSGLHLYEHTEIGPPRKRLDFAAQDDFVKYLRDYDLEGVTLEQVLHNLNGPPQKHANPPGTKLMFTARAASPKHPNKA